MNMSVEPNNKKVFISYSWTDAAHDEWIVSLVEKLAECGIHCVFDKFDLKPGQDKFVFMEQMVGSTEIEKVLVVCDKGYKKKANLRKGGVGTESVIMTPELYGKTDQTKFIPVIAEHDEDGPCLPAFLASRIYVDLSSPDNFQNEFEKLVRLIYDKPAFKRPKLGSPPAYILENDYKPLLTNGKFQDWKDGISQAKPYVKAAEKIYLDALIVALADFNVTDTSDTFDETIVDSIAKMKPLRDQFIEFIELKCVHGNDDDPSFDRIFDFFEQLAALTGPDESVGSYTEATFDNYRFLAWELFLYVHTILIKNDFYDTSARFLSENYHFQNMIQRSTEGLSYTFFDHSLYSIDVHRKQRLGSNRTSISADLFKERADIRAIPFANLMQTDFLLCLRKAIVKTDAWGEIWFPRTLVYMQRHGASFPLFSRVAKPRFETAICKILGVENLSELVRQFDAVDEADRLSGYRFNGAFGRISFQALMNYSAIKTIVAER
ncbi:SEFIR domain-containing protein [Collimonas sp. H4R21]|uniref:SEFIR domain-containing protein n=1 Tax=Collimonas rhizosphaerae TaxID=3126357 RepID=A0ABU9Q2Z6_9BURK